MAGYCSTGQSQSPQRAVVLMEEEEEGDILNYCTRGARNV
jgi:hypothetical protein